MLCKITLFYSDANDIFLIRANVLLILWSVALFGLQLSVPCRMPYRLPLNLTDSPPFQALLFWPQRDFTCKVEGRSSSVIEEDDIVATICAILGLHVGDVVLALDFH